MRWIGFLHAGSNGNSFKALKLQNKIVVSLFELPENPKVKIFHKKSLRELKHKMTNRYYPEESASRTQNRL